MRRAAGPGAARPFGASATSTRATRPSSTCRRVTGPGLAPAAQTRRAPSAAQRRPGIPATASASVEPTPTPVAVSCRRTPVETATAPPPLRPRKRTVRPWYTRSRRCPKALGPRSTRTGLPRASRTSASVWPRVTSAMPAPGTIAAPATAGRRREEGAREGGDEGRPGHGGRGYNRSGAVTASSHVVTGAHSASATSGIRTGWCTR